MPLPTMRDLHQNTPLTQFAEAIVQEESNFVARQVFPVVPTSKRADSYYVFDQGDMARTDAKMREPSAEAPDLMYGVSTATFNIDVWHGRVPIDDMVEANADDIFNLDQLAVRRVVMDLLIREEVDWVAKYFTTSVWTGVSDETLSGTDQWENAASDPIETIRGKIFGVEAATGLRPNTLVIGANVEKRLMDHPDIVDRLKYTSFGSVSRDVLARLLGLERVFVLGAIRNSAVQGAADSIARIAGNHALICHVPSSPSPFSPASGLTFAWSAFSGQGIQIRRYRDESKSTLFVEGRLGFDHVVTGASLGAFISSAVGS